MPQCGYGSGHCCWVNGSLCPFLAERTTGRRWVCTLREGLGSWEAVHSDPGYVSVVKPQMDVLGVQCGDWPGPGLTCAECGESQ